MQQPKEHPVDTPVVLVTGALTGIGRATAVAFAREGARIVVSGRHDDEGRALAAQLWALGAEAEFVHADVRLETDVRALVDKTIEHFGRLDVAVNNAGILGHGGPITDQTAETYADVFDTNVLGVLLSLKHELRAMQPRGHGSIVNISSILGHASALDLSVYSASKHAVDGLTQAAALEAAGSGIRVNGVAPGPTQTPMMAQFVGTEETSLRSAITERVALKRWAAPDEVAQAIVFLASDRASFITGATLSVDGGMVAARSS